MHKIANAAVSFTMVAIAAALAAGQSRQDPLIGRWRSTDVSPSGLSTVFEFRDGHQLDSYSVAISDGKYRLIGTDTIVLQSKGAPEEKLELEWDNADRARIEDESAGKYTNLVRVGKMPESQNPLVGEWSTMREWNGKSYPARASFSSDGRVVWITNVRAEQGRYSVESGNIRLELPGRPVVQGNTTIRADRLTLPNPRGGASDFERF